MTKLIPDKREDQYIKAVKQLANKFSTEAEDTPSLTKRCEMAAQIVSAYIIAEEIERINRLPFPR